MPVRIAFMDTQKLDYVADTPYQRPLGGSQSALCYLAVELARLGHEVAVLNATTSPGLHRGVEFLHLARISVDFLLRFDVIVVLNWAGGARLRREYGLRIPLVLWVSHASDQPVMNRLDQAEERDVWSGFVFVSKWQQERFIERFHIRPDRTQVIRNAISPAFADIPLAPSCFESGALPALAYTSTPFRGLDVLLVAFRDIRRAIPEIRLRVFSSMALYQVVAAQDPFAPLYAQCAVEGAYYYGPLGQTKLAQEMRDVAGLAYPSTFAETSCIAALEAMAAGAFVFTTGLGALPETTNGFAYMVEAETDRRFLAERFAAMMIKTWSELKADSAAACRRRKAQATYVRDHYRWPARAAEWTSWLAQIAK
jgi:glycosyltransferase involved in cell wall biosynthesis